MDNVTLRAKIESEGIAYTVLESVNMTDIKRDGAYNMARQKTFDSDTVAIYKTCIENGDIFPRIILLKKGEKYIVLDGNNRLEAANQCKMTEWPFGAFVVEGITEAQAKEFAYQANLEHGLPASIDDRVAQAMYLVANNGMTIVDAAKKTKSPESTIRLRMNERHAINRINLLNGSMKKINLASSSMAELDRIRDDDIFIKAVELSDKLKMGTDQCMQFSRDIRNIGTTKAQLEFIDRNSRNQEVIKRATAGADEKVKSILKKINTAEVLVLAISKADAESTPKELKGEFLSRVIALKNAVNILYGYYK